MQLVAEKYEKTEIGSFPFGWKVSKIQELIDDGSIISHLDGNHGGLYPKSNEFKESGVPYIGANDFVNGEVNFSTCKFLSNDRAKEFRKGVAKDGDVLFAHNATVGPVAFLKTNLEFVILSTTATYFRCNLNKINNQYLLYALQAPSFVKQYTAVMAQSTRFQVPIGAQRKLSFVLPSIVEQTAIATALSDADALISSLEKLIEKKRNIKQGAMQKLLQPKEGWEVKKLGEVGEIKMCKRIFSNQTKEHGDIPFFKIGTFGSEPDSYISNELYVEFKQKFSYPKKGEILISAAGTIGRTVVYNGEPSYFQDSNIVWIDNYEGLVSNQFLFYILQIVNFNTEGGTIQRLYNSILRNAEFYCPSRVEQIRIITILSDMDAEIAALENKLEKYKNVKLGMMQNLLTGKIRLV